MNNLAELIQAARAENWDKVTELLPQLASTEATIKWAIEEGLNDPDGNARDLAVSVFEANQYELNGEELKKVRNVMKYDQNIYAQYRAAFALYVRGDRSDKVMQKMHAATKDADVKEIAENYLKLK